MRRVDEAMAEHLCTLAQLLPEEGKTPQMREDLEKILAYMAELDAVDTTDVEEHDFEINKNCPMRSDEISDGVPEVLSQAPQVRDHLVVVPKTF